jgi:hypothetical protein
LICTIVCRCLLLLIQKWLTERKAQCPYCRSALDVPSLVNCRFMEDLYAELERLEQNQRNHDPELCGEHQAPLNYFCKHVYAVPPAACTFFPNP